MSDTVFAARIARARRLVDGTLDGHVDVTVAEAVVIGLHRLGVRDHLAVFGHGSTELAEVLRAYDTAGAVAVHPVRHETEAAHAATALRRLCGRRAAVVTSIGPGALHALAGSLAAASNGVGVWHLYGDETTEDEGPNMQQLLPDAQHGFLRMASAMGAAYSLHTPGAVGPALRRGADVVEHPYRAGPFFLLLPINVQPVALASFNLAELPSGGPPRLGAADATQVDRAASVLAGAARPVIKVGGGARRLGPRIELLAEQLGAVVVASPGSAGVVPAGHPRQMGVGGAKGSISGNHAMTTAETLVVVGSRAVCQADCSRTGYPLVREVVNVNADPGAAMHYQRTTALVGDAAATLDALSARLAELPAPVADGAWLASCTAAKAAWRELRDARLARPALPDERWGGTVLTQPAAIAAIAEAAATRRGAVLVFDAGDVQANGFQMIDPVSEDAVFTEAGASYMGFAASAVLCGAIARDGTYVVAVCGDGSFTMNPQVLIDGVGLGARGCIVVLDNRRMGAISSLQRAQYGADFATSDGVAVDYLAWARAVPGVAAFDGGRTLDALRAAMAHALAHPGLSLVHVPVYFGDDPLGGLGAYGSWNVGPWVADVQARRHDLAL